MTSLTLDCLDAFLGKNPARVTRNVSYLNVATLFEVNQVQFFNASFKNSFFMKSFQISKQYFRKVFSQ